MIGLEILYNSDVDFAYEARDYARDYVGSTSYDFAEEWLLHDHAEWHQSDMVNCGKPYMDGSVVLDSAIISSMRSSTDKERAEYEQMLDKHSIDTGVNIFELHDLIAQNDEARQSNVSENLSDNTQNVTDDRETAETPNNSDEDVTDSREKLEADVRKLYTHSTTTLMYPPSANKTTDYIGCVSVDTVLGWLDRAADIREREFVQQYCAECETAENAALKSDIAVLRDRLDNLAAERDEKAGLLETAFRRCKELEAENDALLAAHADDVERLDAMGEGELQAQADEKWNMYVAEHERAEKLQAELDKWNEITKNIKLPEYPPFTQFVPRDDSREEIEREIDEWLGSWVAFSVPISVVKDVVIGWLDRQAAITTRKCSETYELGCEACRSAQKRKTDELDREHEVLRSRLGECADLADRILNVAMGFVDEGMV